MIHSLYHRDDAARYEEDLCFAKQAEVPAGTDPHTAAAAGDKEGPVCDQTSSAGETRMSGEGAARAGALDPYEEMKKLKELLDLDIITREEFDRKKKDLLGL